MLDKKYQSQNNNKNTWRRASENANIMSIECYKAR